jgi:hypothetical protein
VLRRWWNYIKTWFSVKSKEAMDPKIEIEAATPTSAPSTPPSDPTPSSPSAPPQGGAGDGTTGGPSQQHGS